MRQSLTLLQRAVIQRLRDAGYASMADAANDAWRHGEQVNLPNIVREAELRTDYEKANSQVRSEESP